MIDLFHPTVPEHRLHPSFQAVRLTRGYAAARRMMNNTFATLVDTDGNFIEQFSDSRVRRANLELYLHAYFTEGGFQITDRKDRPIISSTAPGRTSALKQSRRTLATALLRSTPQIELGC
jgi:hypothetical protein